MKGGQNTLIYFDNSATTYPKPQPVGAAMAMAVARLGGNPGRGSHAMSVASAGAVYKVREQAAQMFSAQPENVIFTLNCTHALNMAIRGVVKPPCHVVISSLEHNSVSRPVYSLTGSGVSCSVAQVTDSDEETVSNFERLIRHDTQAVIATAVSNVTGRMLPIRQIAQLCRDRGICFICDAAQAAGVIELSAGRDGDIICMPGHKGLYGPAGTGMLITNGRYEIAPLMQGGTGTGSLETAQPPELPESLESGTVNVPGIIGLGKGMEFVRSKSIKRIYEHEQKLCRLLIDRLSRIDGITVYRSQAAYAPVVAFNIGDMHSSDASQLLSNMGFALRGGYQCAAVTHHFLGTLESGVVRFSPSVFNTDMQVMSLVKQIEVIKTQIYL